MLSYKNPLAYKQLRTWQQANEILELTDEFCATLPSKNPQTGQYLTDLKDQMIRSARSVVRNIEEGFRRTTTKEYINFLGFSAGANEELLGDFQYCIKGKLGEQKGALKGEYLCKGEGKMLFNQIRALERKTIREKTASRDDLAKEYYKRDLEQRRKDGEMLEKIIRESRETP